MLGHLARKATRRNHVDVDVLAHQFPGENSRQLMQRRFARPIGIRLLAKRRNPRHRTDIDDPRRIRRRASLAQQRQKLLDATEHRRHIELHDFLPALDRITLQRRAPRGAGVVHQNVQMSDLLTQTRGQFPHAFFGRQIRRHAVATAQRAKFFGGLLAGFNVARAHVDMGAGLDERLGDHLADTTGAAGHQSGAALQGKVGMHDES